VNGELGRINLSWYQIDKFLGVAFMCRHRNFACRDIMNQLTRIILASIIGIGTAQADIYQCKDAKGHTVFSQLPCAQDAKKITVQTYTPTQAEIEGTKAANAQNRQLIDQGQAERHARNLQSKLSSAEQHLRDLKQKRDIALQNLRSKKALANNNLAGAVYENSISNEMRAVSEQYGADISATQQQISDLRREINTK
jgi:hypothetical protein